MAENYGPKVWSVIYQADVRCRLEHMERLKGKLKTQQAAPLTMTRTDPGIQSGRRLCQTKPFGEKRWMSQDHHSWRSCWRRCEGEWSPISLIRAERDHAGSSKDGKWEADQTQQHEPHRQGAQHTRWKIHPQQNWVPNLRRIQWWSMPQQHSRDLAHTAVGHSASVWQMSPGASELQVPTCELQTPGVVKNSKGGTKGRGRGGKGKRPPYWPTMTDECMQAEKE